MAEGSVRTGDELDQARYLRSLDDRIAALERETIVIPDVVFPEVEIPEPCCVCDSFGVISNDLDAGLVPWTQVWVNGTPTVSGGILNLGQVGTWQISVQFSAQVNSATAAIGAILSTCFDGARMGFQHGIEYAAGQFAIEFSGAALIRMPANAAPVLDILLFYGFAGATILGGNVAMQGHLVCLEPEGPFCSN